MVDDQTDNSLEELLSRIALKDRHAFQQLYQNSAAKLFGLLLRIVKREDLAQECLQDAYVLIWNRAGEYRSDKAAPMTWMGSIARYRALDLLRRRKHEAPLDEEMLSMAVDERQIEIEQQLEDVEDATALKECLKQLELKQRNCLYLAYFQGFTHPEIAVRVDAPVGSVKTWIRRGMSQLKECLS